MVGLALYTILLAVVPLDENNEPIKPPKISEEEKERRLKDIHTQISFDDKEWCKRMGIPHWTNNPNFRDYL